MGKAQLLFLAALWKDAHGAARVADFPGATLIQGCYYKNARYYSPTTLKFTKHSVQECQEQCVMNASWGCEYFGFWPASGACYLAGADAVYTEYVSQGAYTGPRVCPSEPSACTEVPSAGYPGSNEENSKLAWPSHRVPEKLACWPKNITGEKYLSCPTVKVLEDTATGWPGKCQGLKKVVVPYLETCKSWCEKSVSCSVWQEVDMPSPQDPQCWQAFWSPGRDCYSGKFYGNRSQRIMHGEVRILKKLYFVELEGLFQAFDENYFIKSEDAVSACKLTCYSDRGCQWWYYNKATGCWVENIQEKALPVPITTKIYHNSSSNYASETVDGEYIQHTCKALGFAQIGSDESMPTYPPTTTGPPSNASGATTTAAEAFSPTSPTPGDEIVLIKPGEEGASMLLTGGNLAKGVLAVSGVDFSRVTDEAKQELADKYATLISVDLGIAKTSVLTLENEAGKTDVESWTPGTYAMRRLSSAGLKAPFKAVLPVSGQAGLSSALKTLSSNSFRERAAEDTWSVLKKYDGALVDPSSLPKVEAALELTGETANIPPPGYTEPTEGTAGIKSSASGGSTSANIWKWALGTLLVVGIILLVTWLVYNCCWKKRSQREAPSKAGFKKLTEKEDDAPLFGGKKVAEEVKSKQAMPATTFSQKSIGPASGYSAAPPPLGSLSAPAFGSISAAPALPSISGAGSGFGSTGHVSIGAAAPAISSIPAAPALGSITMAPQAYASAGGGFAAPAMGSVMAAPATGSVTYATGAPVTSYAASPTYAASPRTMYLPSAATGVQTYSAAPRVTTVAAEPMQAGLSQASRAAEFGLPTTFPPLKAVNLFDQIDADGDGQITREEFQSAMASGQLR
eukprot:gb/GFBE01050768.1/.p1 GENE.gb/GFBE01050768.1/~~gb/GFBE01050768.1/.p1  ORF type:complete len:855 (+),score=141.99 gb/GFBE01050768.1/:1-2565(+)